MSDSCNRLWRTRCRFSHPNPSRSVVLCTIDLSTDIISAGVMFKKFMFLVFFIDIILLMGLDKQTCKLSSIPMIGTDSLPK